MQQMNARNTWTQVALDAAEALAHLDADRLQALAETCLGLHRTWVETRPGGAVVSAAQAREAARGIAALGRVLEATRVNLDVFRSMQVRARLGGNEPLEYQVPDHSIRSAVSISGMGPVCSAEEAYCGHN